MGNGTQNSGSEMRPNNSQQLVTIKEMAAILRLPTSWLYQRTRLGPSAIPHLKIGRYVRFDPREVITFLKSGSGRVLET